MSYSTNLGEPPSVNESGDSKSTPAAVATGVTLPGPKPLSSTIWDSAKDINRKSGATESSDYEIVNGLPRYTGAKYGAQHPIVKLEKAHDFTKEKIKWEGRVRYIRKHLTHCYMKEGVNHYKYCRGLAERYMKELSAEPKWTGF
eukprot:jgi/Bigna1/89203/estExt_fgenesh1_pg.C_450090